MKPTAPVAGQIYIDMETFNALIYTGTDWSKIQPAYGTLPDTRTDKEKVWDALSKPYDKASDHIQMADFLYAVTRSIYK